MSGLELNKICAAVLLAGIIAMVAGFVAEGLYQPETELETRGYSIDVPEVAVAGGVAVEAAPVDILQFLGAADLEAGKKFSKKCTACHSFDKGGANKVGPALWATVGRDIASSDGYAYSDALLAKEGKWGFQQLSEFLTKPKKWAKGTKMVYAGIKKPEHRANLIAYLNSLSASPLPVPAVKVAPKVDDVADVE